MHLRTMRRHHTQRVKAKAKRIIKEAWRTKDGSLDEWVNKNADHLKSCSCYMCGNPRRHFNLETIQEQRAKQNVEE